VPPPPLIEPLVKTRGYGSKWDHWRLCFEVGRKHVAGHVLEFGVATACSTNHIARVIHPATLHAFDSFQGLPEDWEMSGDTTTPKGTFTTNGELPVVAKNVRLWPGFFAETIPDWLSKFSMPAIFIHIDCDIYSSTVEILQGLDERIVPGTVLCFDELYPWVRRTPYANWEEHEYKALVEWLDDGRRLIQPIARDKDHGASFFVLK
jgi:hypothetical protein